MNRTSWILTTGTAVAAVLGSILAPMPKVLIWNASASAPIGLYAIEDASLLDVPDLVAIRPPEPLARFLDDAGYLPLGVPMLKHIAALPGQTICRLGRAIWVDGVAIADALDRDRLGRPLPVWSGCRQLGAQQLFLLNFDVRDSLDGRYFGPIPRNAVIGRAVPIYTDEDGDGRFAWR